MGSSGAMTWGGAEGAIYSKVGSGFQSDTWNAIRFGVESPLFFTVDLPHHAFEPDMSAVTDIIENRSLGSWNGE